MASAPEEDPSIQSTSKPKQSPDANARQVIGNSINTVTDVINGNIIASRYGAIASIALLTAYGISKTPIFFRYKRVSDIPSSLFTNRRIIHGRIVHVVEKDINSLARESGKEESIVCLVRQLSPIARLLNRSSFDFMVGISPSSQVNKGKLHDAKDLLKVEIAGLKAPPFYHAPPGKEGANDWLKSLAASRTSVSCTLLSRRVLKPLDGTKTALRRENNNVRIDQTMFNAVDPDTKQVAVCKLTYRPGMSIFRKDLGSSLVSFGRANVASGMHIEDPSMPTIDGSTALGDIEADVKYLEDLGKREFDGVKAYQGMWSIESIRSSRPDLVEEAEFDINAGFWSKLWRKIRKD